MNVEIAERLAARRKLAGLSQEALAEKLGVSRQAVSKWERSESSPDTDNLIALAKLYGVSLDELLYVDESIEDDVAFEAADRAEARGAGASVVVAEGAAPPKTAEVCEGAGGGGGFDADADAAANAGAAGAGAAGVGGAEDIDFEKEGRGKVHFGPGGIHVDDGKDHVHVSWAEGVHVVDRHGEEVHVGWDGVRVNTADPDAADHIFTRDNPFGAPFDGFDAERAKKWLRFRLRHAQRHLGADAVSAVPYSRVLPGGRSGRVLPHRSHALRAVSHWGHRVVPLDDLCRCSLARPCLGHLPHHPARGGHHRPALQMVERPQERHFQK